MRILILSQFWYPENGVPQRRWSWLSGLLKDKGHSVTVIAPPANYRRNVTFWESLKSFSYKRTKELEKGPSGEIIYRSAFLSAGTSLTGRAVSQAVIAIGALGMLVSKVAVVRNVDVIIGTVPALPTAVVCYLAAKVFSKPYIIDLRDAWPDLLDEHRRWNEALGKKSIRQRILERGPIQILSWVVKRALNYVLRHADGIVVTSKDLELSLRKRAESAGNDLRIITIRNVFPTRTISSSMLSLRAESNRLNVLYAGTLGRAQNLHNAIEAAAIANRRGTKVRLRIVGGGVAAEHLREFAAIKNVPVEFFPFRSASALRDCYDWADTALVHLSGWEPLSRAVPSKTFELMSVGIHITGVVEGEAERLISALKAGDTVPPEDPRTLASLWEELSRHRERLVVGKAAKEWVEKERNVNTPLKLESFLNEVVAGGGFSAD